MAQKYSACGNVRQSVSMEATHSAFSGDCRPLEFVKPEKTAKQQASLGSRPLAER